MKKILIIVLGLYTIFAAGCSNAAKLSISYFEVKSTDEDIGQWAKNNKKANGIYLGKSNEITKGEIFYLYLNYTNLVDNKYYIIDRVSINSNGKESIIIEARPRSSDEKGYEKIFRIEVKDKPLESIVLNGETIKASSILVIQ